MPSEVSALGGNEMQMNPLVLDKLDALHTIRSKAVAAAEDDYRRQVLAVLIEAYEEKGIAAHEFIKWLEQAGVK